MRSILSVPGGRSIRRKSSSPHATSDRNSRTAPVSIELCHRKPSPEGARQRRGSVRVVLQQLHRHHADTAGGRRRNHALGPIHQPLPGRAQHAGQGRAVQIRVQRTHRAALSGEGGSQVGRHQALADPPLAAPDGDQAANPGQPALESLALAPDLIHEQVARLRLHLVVRVRIFLMVAWPGRRVRAGAAFRRNRLRQLRPRDTRRRRPAGSRGPPRRCFP